MQHVAELTISLRMRRQRCRCRCCSLRATVVVNCQFGRFGFMQIAAATAKRGEEWRVAGTTMTTAQRQLHSFSSSCSGRLISICKHFHIYPVYFNASPTPLRQWPLPSPYVARVTTGSGNGNSSCFFFINGLPFRFYVQLYFSLARYFSLPDLALPHIWPLDLLPLLLLLLRLLLHFLLLSNLAERIINNHFSLHVAILIFFYFRVLICLCLRITICLASDFDR